MLESSFQHDIQYLHISQCIRLFHIIRISAVFATISSKEVIPLYLATLKTVKNYYALRW